jgi:uncharacterized membrane protein
MTYTKVAIMRRIHIFLFILTASLGLLVVLFAASLYLASAAPTPYQSSWMQQMWHGMGMNGMMGGMGYGGYATPQTAASSYLWLIPAGLIGFVAIGVVGVVFFFAFPEIKPVTEIHKATKKEPGLVDPKKDPVAETPSPSAPINPYESVSKTLTPEERKVLDVLVTHQGKYLQKYIRKEAGLSRLKTHRIIARFAERGIVTLKQSGNTNEVVLLDWLKDSKPLNSA